MEGLNGDSVCQSLLTNNERRVNNLWDLGQKRCKRDTIIDYGIEMGECIFNLPIPPINVNDSRTWLHNPHGNNEESLIHALKECPKVRETLIIGGLNNRLLDGNYVRCIDWLEDILRELDSKAAADLFTLLWKCWNNRNKMVFQGKDNPAMMVWERTQTLSNDFRIFNLNEPPVIPPTPVCKGWRKPPKYFIKINVDAAVLNRNVGYGAIVRDADGFVIVGCYVFENKAIDVVRAELKALPLGLKLASRLNMTKIIMESDNATLINTIKNRDKDVTILGCCVKQECEAIRKFDTIHFNWIDRNSNEVADMLCKIAIKNRCDLMFNMDYPLEIHNIII
ncbi:hypothetical protein Gogos_013204 [Gossypium gossypioides]|uniref:RNase H type-1 domain-containing protein n=1 Tax=Gossypium gossypioides TaxID=34282 RepID=A0A7J9BUV8_GOSGO|nr:hypothetical protein [Gossypium gossypioides]